MVNRVIERTRKIYDVIAKEWDISRPFLKPHWQKLFRGVKAGQKILDVGCGNGIVYEFLAPRSIDYTGLDFSRELLKIAKKRAKRVGGRSKARFVLGEATALSLKDQSFDWVFPLAVYHHLPTPSLRQLAVKEAWRVLKPGGGLVMSGWNLRALENVLKYKLRKNQREAVIPWRASGRRFDRYVHIFTAVEVRLILKKAGFRKIKIKTDKNLIAEAIK